MDLATKITLIVAIYGAILSTIAIIWNISRNLLDKPKLKVVSSLGLLSWGEIEKIVSFEAINIGRYPITLSSAGLHLENNKTMFFMSPEDRLPIQLNPGTNHTIFRPLDKFLKEIKKEGNPLYVWFKDQTGKEYRGKMVNLKNFMKNDAEK